MGIIDRARDLMGGNIPTPYEAPAQAQPASALRPITASGEKIDLRNQDDIANMRYRVYAEWQHDAWGYYDAIGEIKYGFGMLASVLSRVRLFPSLNLDPDSVPISTVNYRRRRTELTDQENAEEVEQELKAPESITDEVMDYMEELIENLSSGPGGMSSFLRSYTLNMAVPGECYLVEIKGEWSIKSSSEIVVDAGGQVLLRRQRVLGGANASGGSVTSNGSTVGDVVLPKTTPLIRIWREHPRYSLEPESSMLGLREACDELLTLQRMIRAVARSSMNAGVLFIPDSLRAAGSTIAEDIATDEELSEELIATLYDNFVAPITDETNAASVVPTILTGPGAAGKEIQYIEINRKVDQFLTERCDRALERVLQGIDMPKDFVTGMANVRYTNAKNIDESLYKSHIEPMVLMLVDALNVGYFRPMLRKKFSKTQLSDRDLRKYLTVWYDPSEIVTRADPAESADKGFDKFALSADAWRAAHGFADTDAPSELEQAVRMLQKSPLPPDLVTPLFNAVFEQLVEKQRAQNMAKNPGGGFPDSAADILGIQQTTDGIPGTNGAPAEVEEASDPTAPQPGNPADITMDESETEKAIGTNPNERIDETADDELKKKQRKMGKVIEDDDSIIASAVMLRSKGLYNSPYKPTDMQEKYRAIAEAAVRDSQHEVKTVATADLIPTQPPERSNTSNSGAGAKGLPPIVIKTNDKLYLIDGHHRALGRTKIVAAIVDVDHPKTTAGVAV